MKLRIEVSETELRSLVHAYFRDALVNEGLDIKAEDIVIEVKSKQNYKSEWEQASFRAVYSRGS